MNYRKVLWAKIIICFLVLLVLVGLVSRRMGMVREEENNILFFDSDDNDVVETGALSEDLVETNVARNAAEVILQEQENVSKKQNAIDYTFIRVLLTNEDGGYYFDRVKIKLCGKEYSYQTKQVKKRGVVRIQTMQPEEKITLFSKEGDVLGEYRGALILRATGEGITIVNQLLLEEYLYQVVPGEMPASYPEEALKAQAVLARTYAAKYVEQPAFPDYYADLDDTTSFQVYGNKGEFDTTNRVVKETEGMVLAAPVSTDNEGESARELAEIYYFSTSCGVTTTTEAWFQRKNPLEKSVFMAPSNQLAISLPSEAKDTLQELTAGNASGKKSNMDNIASAEKDLTAWLKTEEGFWTYINQVPKNAYEAEMPWFRWTYETSRSGKQLMERIRTRYEVKPNQFLSREKDSGWFIMGRLAELGELQNIRVTKRAPGGCVCEIQLEGSKADIRVRTEYSIRYVLCDPQAKVVLQDGSERNMETILPSAFFTISCSKQKKDVVGYSLVGGGFGHGIGMSQNGASKMAEQGMDYGEIVSFFYPGYEIVDIQRMGKK